MKAFQRTRIVCTLGPATEKEGVLERMVEAGMNVARLNFSHGSQEEHMKRINQVYAVREKTGYPLGLLLDTRGPEIRIHTFAAGSVYLEEGQTFTLYAQEKEGDENGISVTYPRLAEELEIGTRILVDDGKISMIVEQLDGADIVCRVENSGKLSNRKSINIPGVALNLPYINEKDRKDILFGCEQDVDFIAASFVRSADDIRELKALLRDAGALERIQIIAKIENKGGYDHLDEILQEADGVMIARGDMGVEVEFDLLPTIQKTIIKRSLAEGKIVITATQMLDSMTENPRPTRAEVSDVANAVYDGTTAVMLSGETSVGEYPVETVQTMAAIVRSAENNIHYASRRATRPEFQEIVPDKNKISAEIARTAVAAAESLDAAVIAAVTMSGRTVRAISSLHPEKPIAGMAPSDKLLQHMTLQFGVIPIPIREGVFAGEFQIKQVMKSIKANNLGEKGNLMIYTAGLPAGSAHNTNTLCIREIE